MSNKNYKELAHNKLQEFAVAENHSLGEAIRRLEAKKFKPDEAEYLARNQREWRRSAPNYELPIDDDTAFLFEIVGHNVVDDPNGVVASAFSRAGLDPRNPSHWYQIVEAFATILLERKKQAKKISRKYLDKLKATAEEIRRKDPKIRKAKLLELIKSTSPEKYPAEDRLGDLLLMAGFRYFKQPTKHKPIVRKKARN